MNSIEETAEQFNVVRPLKRSIMQIIQSIRSAQYYISQHKYKADNTAQEVSSATENAQGQVRDINFTGQHTDIAFCDQHGAININDINSIDDYKLRNNVLDTFNKAKDDGYLYFDGNYFTLTDKGHQHIYSSAFMEQFEKDQKDYIVNHDLNNTVSINLTGAKDDLNIFKYVDSINLNKLSYDNPAKFKQVVSYMEKCEKYGFVNISKDGIVTPTEKTKNMLSQSTGQINMQKINTNNFDKVIDINKYLNTAKGTQSAVKAGTTATKAGATAATGAATAGVSTAVQAVVELSQKANKAFEKAQQLNQSRKVMQSNRT